MRAMRLWRSAFTKVKNARMFVRSVEAEMGRSDKTTNHKGDEADKDIEIARLLDELAAHATSSSSRAISQLRALLHNTADTQPVLEPVQQSELLVKEVLIVDDGTEESTKPKEETTASSGPKRVVAAPRLDPRVGSGTRGTDLVFELFSFIETSQSTASKVFSRLTHLDVDFSTLSVREQGRIREATDDALDHPQGLIDAGGFELALRDMGVQMPPEDARLAIAAMQDDYGDGAGTVSITDFMDVFKRFHRLQQQEQRASGGGGTHEVRRAEVESTHAGAMQGP
jgi:hypothetical protein